MEAAPYFPIQASLCLPSLLGYLHLHHPERHFLSDRLSLPPTFPSLPQSPPASGGTTLLLPTKLWRAKTRLSIVVNLSFLRFRSTISWSGSNLQKRKNFLAQKTFLTWVFAPDYMAAFAEIQRITSNSTYSSRFEYLQGKKATFGGNLSINERKSFFDLENYGGDGASLPSVPCGFFKEFPLRLSGDCGILVRQFVHVAVLVSFFSCSCSCSRSCSRSVISFSCSCSSSIVFWFCFFILLLLRFFVF